MKKKFLKNPGFRRGMALIMTLIMCISLIRPLPAAAKTGDVQNIPGGTITKVENPTADLNQFQTTETKKLKTTDEYFDKDDLVTVIVVLKDKPLLERGYTATNFARKAAAKATSDNLVEKQDELFAAIQEEVKPSNARKGAQKGSESKTELNYHFTLALNGISITIPYGELSTIKEMDGVEAAFIAPQYSVEPMTQESGNMIGRSETWNSGYTGTGMKIAIVDTGMNVSHKVFTPLPESKLTNTSLTKEDVAATLSRNYTALHANEIMKGDVTADQLYFNTKIPYGFDYASHDVDIEAGENDHGIHVAGIAAGNKTETKDGLVVGVAPDAQVMVMKVFDDTQPGANFDSILAAVDDAMALGADVINMSLGSAAGFTKETAPDVEAVHWTNRTYDNIFHTDTVLAVAAGNEGSSADGNAWGNSLNPTDCPDNATVGSPSTYEGPTSVASIDNESSLGFSVTVEGRKIVYTDPAAGKGKFTNLSGKKLQFAMVGNLGMTDKDFTDAKVKGKIAVVQRGTCTFTEKQQRAKQAGAVGCIVYDNVVGPAINMAVEDNLPCVFIGLEDGKYMAAMAKKGKTAITVSANGEFFFKGSNIMSSFSSWGVTPDLQLKPEITAPGGNIYSSRGNGTYGLMSGTSMATPHVAGVAALVMQALREKGVSLPQGEMRQRVDSLMMSTAMPVLYDEKTEVPYSPRLQGAGLVNAYSAITSNAYLSVEDSAKPKISMGDDVKKTGVYTFSFDINNTSDHEIQYKADADVLTEDFVDYQQEGIPYFMSQTPAELEAAVAFESSVLKDGVITVPKNGKAQVKATITLSQKDKEYMEKYFAKGSYVEGFVNLTAVTKDERSLTLPYMGFYGDWTAAGIFDAPFTSDYNMTSSSLYGNFDGEASSAMIGNNFNSDSPALPEHFVVSPNGDGTLDLIDDMYISLMRNAKYMDISFVNHDSGTVYFKERADYVYKSLLNSDTSQVVPFIYSWYIDKNFDFTYHNSPLPNGTKVDLVLTAASDYSKHESGNKNQKIIPITVDVKAPVIEEKDVKLTKDEKTGKTSLEVTVADDTYLSSLIFGNKDFTKILSSNEFTDEEHKTDAATGKKMVTRTYDVTGYGNDFSMMVCDYGYNCSYYDINVTDWNNSEGINGPLVLPHLADGSGTGWDHILASVKEQIKTAAGAELALKINMGSATIVPKSVLAAIAGKNVYLNIVMSNGAGWWLYGENLNAKTVTETNFGVKLGLAAVPEQILNEVVKERSYTQFTLDSKNYNYASNLDINVADQMGEEETAMANLYRYNPQTKKLTLVSVSGITNKTAEFTVSEEGNYVVIVDKKTDITKEMVFQAKLKNASKTLYAKAGKGKAKTYTMSLVQNPVVQEAIDWELMTVKATYASSNAKVASVSKSGTITAKKAGTATITATYKIGTVTIKRSLKVTVK